MTAIDDKHALLRASVVDLGEPIGPETDLGDGGSMREYEFGTICFHPDVGAFEVHGLIRETYLNQWGGPLGRLGYPTSDETGVGGGRLNTFELGESGLFFDSGTGISLIDDLGLRQFERTFSDTILAYEPVAAGQIQSLCFPPGSVTGSLRGCNSASSPSG
jgi:LGFP repeat